MTIARGFSDTFAGIYPGRIGMFVLMQLIGVGVAHLALTRLFKD